MMVSHTRRHPVALFAGFVVGVLLVGVLAAMIDPRQAPVSPPASVLADGDVAIGEGGAAAPGDADRPGALTPRSVPEAGAPPERAGGEAAATTPATPDAPVGAAGGGEVHLGILLLELASARQIGFQSPGVSAEGEREAYDAIIGLVNDEGGIGGRRIVPFYRKFNPLDPDSMQAACVALAQDGKVFAAIAGPGFFNQNTLCLTERFGIPTISFQGESEEWQHRTRGLLVTKFMTSHRMLRTLVHVADRQRRFSDRTIGIVTSQAPADLSAVKGALEPALADLGYTVAHTSVLAERTGDGASQIPVEIVEMRRKGVDLVVFATSALYFGMWVNEADAQQFRPLYLGSDVGAVSDDFSVQNAPATLRAIAYTADRGGEHRLNRPEPPADASCHQRYRQRTGKTLDRSEGAAYNTAVRACGFIDLFVAAARKALATDIGLTRAGYITTLRSLGPWDLPYTGPGSLQPGKLGIADSVRSKEYRGNCRCWVPVDEFTPAPR